MASDNSSEAHEIVFGMNRQEDERSLVSFLDRFSSEELTSALVPRMTDAEISQTVHFLTGLMRNHLSKQEYHTLFLNNPDHRH